MNKPTEEQMKTASSQQLAEWSAIWVMRWKKKKKQILGNSFVFWDSSDSLIETCEWNPAENAHQALELLEKIKDRFNVSFVLQKPYTEWSVVIWADNKNFEKRIFEKELSRAITIAALLAAIENG